MYLCVQCKSLKRRDGGRLIFPAFFCGLAHIMQHFSLLGFGFENDGFFELLGTMLSLNFVLKLCFFLKINGK